MIRTRFRLTRKQKNIVNCKADYVLALTDRRFGKEYVCLAKALKECRKKSSVVVWVTFNNQMKEAVKDFAVQFCKDSRGEIIAEKDCVTFRNGSRLYFVSCNVHTTSLSNIRGITGGRSPTFMIFDECGYFTKDQWAFVFNTVCEKPCKSLFISSVYKNTGTVPLCFNTGFLEKGKLIDYRCFNNF